MDHERFRGELDRLGYDEAKQVACINAVENFERHLAAASGGASLETTTQEQTYSYCERLAVEGRNPPNTFIGIGAYARMIGNHGPLLAIIDVVAGHNIMGNIRKFTAEEVGEELRDEIFEGLEIPPLGTRQAEWVQVTSALMPRMEAALDRETIHRILERDVREVDLTRFDDFKARYEDVGDIDVFLKDRRRQHLEMLEGYRDRGDLYFNQLVTQELIDFVREHPEIGGGVRHGNTIVEMKIPYRGIEYLSATDERMKQYYVCHCPWVREAIPRDDISISPTICDCCPSYNRRPWDAVFGEGVHSEVVESALLGDLWCRFAIHIPEGAFDS